MGYRKQKQTPEEYLKLHQQRKENARKYYAAPTKFKIIKSIARGPKK